VQTGPARVVSVKRSTLEYAVGLLLKTDVRNLDAEGISKLERNVLLISRQIGMLTKKRDHPVAKPQRLREEPLSKWIETATWIQRLFQLRDDRDRGAISGLKIEAPSLSIHMDYSPNHISIKLRPIDTIAALLYSAVQMIARGIAAHACDHCGAPVLSGGERDRRNKKRAGSRFCSDKCRYEYHNERRRKIKAKS
jgi:hypothetical protein